MRETSPDRCCARCGEEASSQHSDSDCIDALIARFESRRAAERARVLERLRRIRRHFEEVDELAKLLARLDGVDA